jgi:hypothetical protein
MAAIVYRADIPHFGAGISGLADDPPAPVRQNTRFTETLPLSPSGGERPSIVKLRHSIRVIDLLNQLGEFGDHPVQLRQEVGWIFGGLLALLDQRICQQTLLNLCDSLLRIGPTNECFG